MYSAGQQTLMIHIFQEALCLGTFAFRTLLEGLSLCLGEHHRIVQLSCGAFHDWLRTLWQSVLMGTKVQSNEQSMTPLSFQVSALRCWQTLSL